MNCGLRGVDEERARAEGQQETGPWGERRRRGGRPGLNDIDPVTQGAAGSGRGLVKRGENLPWSKCWARGRPGPGTPGTR